MKEINYLYHKLGLFPSEIFILIAFQKIYQFNSD